MPFVLQQRLTILCPDLALTKIETLLTNIDPAVHY